MTLCLLWQCTHLTAPDLAPKLSSSLSLGTPEAVCAGMGYCAVAAAGAGNGTGPVTIVVNINNPVRTLTPHAARAT